MATTSDINLVDTWLNGTPEMGASDHISDPFDVVTYHHKRCKTKNPGSPTSKQNAEKPSTAASKGDSSPPSQSDCLSQAAANSFLYSLDQSYIGRYEVQTDHFNFVPTNKPIDDDYNFLHMPMIMNPHENGLRRSPHLRKQRKKEESNKRKSHVTFGTTAATKLSFVLFLLIALASNFTMP